MLTRRFFALFLASFLLVVPVAAAKTAAPKLPVKVKPQLSIAPVLRSDSSIRPPITVVFELAKGTKPATTCKGGGVMLTIPYGKRTIKKHGKKRKVTLYAKKRAKFKPTDTGCTATGAPKLPVTMIGKRAKVTASFKGNSAIKKFKKTSRLLVSEPPPTPAPEAPRIDPTKGAWIAQGKDSQDQWQQWSFTVNADGSVTSIRRYSLLNIACPGYSAGTFTIDNTVAPFDTPFSMTYVDTTASDGFQQDAQNISQTFKLHFDSPSHATGSFQMTGAIEGPQVIAVTTTVYPGCDSGVIPLEFTPGSFG